MRAVVVTGTSTGIGKATALMLDEQGFHVFAGVRRRVDADALERQASERLTPIHLEVTDDESIQAARELVEQAVGPDGLAGLVNNAGSTVPCPVEYLPMEEFRHQLEVNLFGPFALVKTFLPLLEKGCGRIVNVTSAGGRIAIPYMATYSASKFGLEGLSDTLRMELGRLGMHVSVVEPGGVATSMRGKLIRDTERWVGSFPTAGRERYGKLVETMARRVDAHSEHGSPPEVIARAILHALTSRRPKTRYAVGAGAKRLLALRRILSDRMVDPNHVQDHRRRLSPAVMPEISPF